MWYNSALMKPRVSRYIKIARRALALCQNVVPAYTHRFSPHRFTQPQLLACVLLMFYVRKSYRDMFEWLLASDQVLHALELTQLPAHTTLWRAFDRLRREGLDQLLMALLAELDLQEDAIAVDTTGFQPTQASRHYLARRGVAYDHFLKGGFAVGTRSQLILAWKTGLGPGADQPYLSPLRRGATRYGRHEHGRIAWLLLADAGFDAQEIGELDLIPPIRRGGVLRDPRRIARWEWVSAARLDGVYGQRWISETVNSVIKRKFGEDVRSRTPRRQNREILVKGLIYNLHRLELMAT